MKVKAKHWLKYGNIWYKGGDTFEIPTTDAKELGDMVELAETPVSVPEPEVEETPVEQPKRRGRKAKATAE